MKCEVLIDWLTFSVKEKDPNKVIQQYLGMDPALFQDTGFVQFMGYSKVLRFSDILVCSDGREDEKFHDMGVCVSMSGNGCRTFETMSKLTLDLTDKQGTQSVAFPALFQLLASDADANISRIDIACDDREGYLCMDDIVRKVQDNEVNSRMTRRSTVISFDGTQRSGATAYIGAPSSDFRVRIYDKALEEGTDGHWVRVELVMRGKNSNAFVEQMTNSEHVGKLAAQVINDKFSFIERDDSNIASCVSTPLPGLLIVSRLGPKGQLAKKFSWLFGTRKNFLVLTLFDVPGNRPRRGHLLPSSRPLAASLSFRNTVTRLPATSLVLRCKVKAFICPI